MRNTLFTAVCLLSLVLFGKTRTEEIREKLLSDDRNYVFVAVHRGDRRNFPENSEGAILSAINIGAEIVELDVRRTKDGHFVLMHDRTVDRTTNGKGRVSEMTLAELKELHLKFNGDVTKYRIPTLEEALALAKGKIMINIDKFGEHPKEILDVVNAAGSLGEVIVKATFTMEKVKKLFGEYWEKVESGDLIYMPIVYVKHGKKPFSKGIFSSFAAAEPRKGSMYEIVFDDPADVAEAMEAHSRLPGRPRLHSTTLWDSLSARHSDSDALLDPDGVWGWWLEKHPTIILTDCAPELIIYLQRKGLRIPEATADTEKREKNNDM